jgi:hypothetical protein
MIEFIPASEKQDPRNSAPRSLAQVGSAFPTRAPKSEVEIVECDRRQIRRR